MSFSFTLKTIGTFFYFLFYTKQNHKYKTKCLHQQLIRKTTNMLIYRLVFASKLCYTTLNRYSQQMHH